MVVKVNEKEMINYETNIYINLIRIKRLQKEINPELEYQLKTQKNKLHNLGINTEDFEFEDWQLNEATNK